MNKYHVCGQCGCQSGVDTGIGQMSECSERIEKLEELSRELSEENADYLRQLKLVRDYVCKLDGLPGSKMWRIYKDLLEITTLRRKGSE